MRGRDSAASRREFLKTAGAAALAATAPAAFFLPDLSAPERLSISGTRIELLRMLSRPLDYNVLKLFDVAADSSLRRLFVSGIMTSRIAVLDDTTHAVLGTVDSRLSGQSYPYLAIDTSSNRLYIRDANGARLAGIDLNTGAHLGIVSIESGLGGIVASRGYVYITTAGATGLRIYDGTTLASVFATNAMGNALPSIVHDAAADVLYLLDSAEGAGRIFRMQLATRAITEIPYDSGSPIARPSRLARSSDRFFVLSSGAIKVLTADGRTERTVALPNLVFQDIAYNAADGRLLALFLDRPANGEVAASGARLYALSGSSFGEVAAFGHKPGKITISSRTGRFYCPAADESTVWWGSSNSNTVSGLRVGDSVERFVPSPADGTVFINSRLGGGYLVAYNPTTRTVFPFSAGTWPTGMAINSSGSRFAVLNAWDSTISLYDVSAARLLSTIAIGLPRGTTDRLPDFVCDFTRDRAYASYPEFGQAAVVDLTNGRNASLFSIDGFAIGDVDGGPNQIQLALSESAARLLVMSPSLRRLDVYDISGTPTRVAQTALPASVLQTGSSPTWKILFVDAARGRAFIGVEEYDVVTGRPTGARLSRGQRVFAADEVRNLYWAAAIVDNTIVVYTFDRTTLAAVDTFQMGAVDTLPPDFALDAGRGRLYMAHVAAAEFDQYVIGGATGGAPGVPSGLTSSVSGTTVTLQWTAPTTGGAVNSYLVDAGSASGLSDLASIPAATTSFSGAAPPGRYYVRVRAMNASGTSSGSNETVVTVGTTAGCTASPAAPSSLSSSVTGREVRLGWVAPTTGSAPTSYQIEAGSASGLGDLAAFNTGSTSVAYSVSAPPGRYFVRVKAVNSCGISTGTNEVTILVS